MLDVVTIWAASNEGLTVPPETGYSSPLDGSSSSDVVITPSGSPTNSASSPTEVPDICPYSIYVDSEGTQWYKCSKCGRPIKDRRGPSNFWDHGKTHDPNRELFPCKWTNCVAVGRTFTRERELKRHVEKHRGILPKPSTKKRGKKSTALRPQIPLY
ncbi:hypothetical protein C8T65DRAFT_103126 [Cerioporus squamosus]|nr:hypothetical protein C8T65DRAFT_103126 [Cerioporus squamosus]